MAMTEGSESVPTDYDPDASADSTPSGKRRALFSRLNRTNRIAALVLGSIGAVLVVVLIFGAGVLVGSEFGDSEGDHYVSDDFDRGDGDRESRHDGDRGEPDSPDVRPPAESNGPPRP